MEGLVLLSYLIAFLSVHDTYQAYLEQQQPPQGELETVASTRVEASKNALATRKIDPFRGRLTPRVKFLSHIFAVVAVPDWYIDWMDWLTILNSNQTDRTVARVPPIGMQLAVGVR
jgi:hypothetical protein